MPGLMEVSPEELRLLVYTANSAGTLSAFLQNMDSVKRRQADARQQYMNITPEEVTKLVRLMIHRQFTKLFVLFCIACDAKPATSCVQLG